MSTQLIAVVLHLGASKLEAIVDDGTGMRRRINLEWTSRTDGDNPPETWLESIEGEVDYQRGQVSPLRRLMGGFG